MSEEVSFLTFPGFSNVGWLKHGYSLRLGGVCAGAAASLSLGAGAREASEEILENRKRFLRALNISASKIVVPRQVHGADVLVVNDGSESGEADGAICDKAGIPLMVLGADCPLVLLADSRTRAFAVVHSGRRSTIRHIAVRAIEAMIRHFGTRAEDVLAGVGPGIQASCYEVDDKTAEEFSDAFCGRFISPRGSRFVLDLPGAIAFDLNEIGVLRVDMIDRCTHCEVDLFHSYRRDGKYAGRMGLLACIV